jgi:hypothetical protein
LFQADFDVDLPMLLDKLRSRTPKQPEPRITEVQSSQLQTAAIAGLQ